MRDIILVDSNVLLDIATANPNWFDWSAKNLSYAFEEGRPAYHPMILSEVSGSFFD